MRCDGCGNDRARRIRYSAQGEVCDECGGLGSVWIPDVSFTRPYLDPNLPHPDRPWEADGVWVESRQHKARLLAEQNLVEKGDKRGGMRNEDKFLQRRAKEQLGSKRTKRRL